MTDHRSPSTTDHLMVLVAYDGIQALDLTGPHEVFAAANRVANGFGTRGCRYRLNVIGPCSATIVTESGLRLAVDSTPDPEVRIDTLLVPGGDSAIELEPDDSVVNFVRDAGRRAGRVACVCTGTFVAAQAGLLEGRHVTTHWARAAALAERFPDLQVSEDAIFLEDRGVWTSAGVTAGFDLALAMVENDLGTEVAQEVARWLVVFMRRPGGQSQFAPTVWQRRAPDGPIRQAQDLIHNNPAQVTSVAQLAATVGFSTRHFTRRFTAEAGVSPAKYLERVRVSLARTHLEAGHDGVSAVAERCGFGSTETLRQVFHRQLGVSPDDYRSRFQRGAPTPTN